MSESSRAEITFEFRRGELGLYDGTVHLDTNGEKAVAKHTDLTRKEWVALVVETIRWNEDIHSYAFKFANTDRIHRLDSRTVEKIKNGSLTTEDLVL